MSDIGPGMYVERTVVDLAGVLRVGGVYLVDGYAQDGRICVRCYKNLGSLLLLGQSPRGRPTNPVTGRAWEADGWCPCGFRPYQGPEQAKREVSEREPA